MLNSLAKYFFGDDISDARNSQGSNNGTSESLAVIPRLNEVEVEGEDWVLIDHADEAIMALEESWYVTPPACFTRAGPVNVETSPLEDLLIEHPSMSVYRATTSPVVPDTPPLELGTPEEGDLEEVIFSDVCSEPIVDAPAIPKSLPPATSPKRIIRQSAKKKSLTNKPAIHDGRPAADRTRTEEVVEPTQMMTVFDSWTEEPLIAKRARTMCLSGTVLPVRILEKSAKKKQATTKPAIHDGRPAADRIHTEKVMVTVGPMQKVIEMRRIRPSALDERSKQPPTRGYLKEKYRNSRTNNFLEARYRQPLTRGYLERGNKLREVFGVRGKRPRRQDRLRIQNSGANNNRKC